MSSRPLVTVVIPTYNRSGLVRRAIASALAQTYPALEVVVVDDGSTDGTLDELRQLHGGDTRVRLMSRPNGGAAAARNTGIEAATGDYVAFLDSDDEWLPWKLELQVSCMERDPSIGMCWSDFRAIDVEGRVISERYLRTMYKNLRGRRLGDVFETHSLVAADAPRTRPDLARVPIYSGDIFLTMLFGSIVHTSTVLLRAEIVRAVGPFDERLRPNGEDFDYHLRTSQVTKVGFVDTPTTSYRVGAADQLSGDHHMVALARNGLVALESRLTGGEVDSRVDDAVARRARAGAQEWLGLELIAAGERREGRKHLWASWRLSPSWRALRRLGRERLKQVLRRGGNEVEQRQVART